MASEMKENPDMVKIRRQLRRMAFSKANDCVKLALNAYTDIEDLDLALLSEIKKSDKGVEIKLLDRTKILAQLAEFTKQDGQSAAAAALLSALERDEDDA